VAVNWKAPIGRGLGSAVSVACFSDWWLRRTHFLKLRIKQKVLRKKERNPECIVSMDERIEFKFGVGGEG
jgi:hypothetical protein